MINRFGDPKAAAMRPSTKRELSGGVVGIVVGVVLGAGGMFLLGHAHPATYGGANDTVCGDAAERFAQLDATWRDLTLAGTRTLPTSGARADDMPLARGQALQALDECRGLAGQ